jgi:hypothetical protein
MPDSGYSREAPQPARVQPKQAHVQLKHAEFFWSPCRGLVAARGPTHSLHKECARVARCKSAQHRHGHNCRVLTKSGKSAIAPPSMRPARWPSSGSPAIADKAVRGPPRQKLYID